MKNEVGTKKGSPNRASREVEYEHQKFISIRVAARLAGLSHTTLYKWAREGQTSDGRRLTVIRDTLTNQILISENSIRELIEHRFRRVAPSPPPR